MNTKPDNNDLLRLETNNVVIPIHVDRSAMLTVSEELVLYDVELDAKNITVSSTQSRVNWPGSADHFGQPYSKLKSSSQSGDPFEADKTPGLQAGPLMSAKTSGKIPAALFKCSLQLNGTHGEYTDDDDLADFERKRNHKEANNKKIHGKPGNSHKPANPGIKAHNLCQEFLTTSECLVPGCPFVHNRGAVCPRENCALVGCLNIHRFVPPPPPEAPAIVVPVIPEFEEVHPVGRDVPTNRVDRIMYSNSIITRLVIFMVWSMLMLTLREYFFFRSQDGSKIEYTIFYLCYLYLEQIRFINSFLFVLSLQYSDEYVELIRHIKTGRYHLIYEMGPDTIYSGGVSLAFTAFVYISYPDFGEKMQLLMISFFLVICFKTWVSVADYTEATIFGDQVKVSKTRYDTETWSWRCGAIRSVHCEVIDKLVDNLMIEFMTSDCTLLSTQNRILFSAGEQTKKMRCNGEEIHIDVIFSSAKMALQRLKGYQMSCVLDGALVKRPQTAPMI